MSSNFFNKKGLTIRFNNLRLNLIKSLKDRDTDVHELKDSLEGMYFKICNGYYSLSQSIYAAHLII